MRQVSTRYLSTWLLVAMILPKSPYKAAGYVKRMRSSEDRRESVARITDKGLALLLAMDETVSKEERLIGNCLKSREWTTLAVLCQRLFPSPNRPS